MRLPLEACPSAFRFHHFTDVIFNMAENFNYTKKKKKSVDVHTKDDVNTLNSQ